MAKGLAANRKAVEHPRGFVELIAFPTFVTIFLAGRLARRRPAVHGVRPVARDLSDHQPRLADLWSQRRSTTIFSRIWAITLTYLAVLLAQVFFRASSVPDAVKLLGGAFGSQGVELPLPVRESSLVQFGRFSGFLLDHHLIHGRLARTFTTP